MSNPLMPATVRVCDIPIDSVTRRHQAQVWSALLCASFIGLFTAQLNAADGKPFELNAGDRVVLLGNTFIERDQKYGYLEALLTAHFSDRDILFRNLGWSGDTVFGHARAVFGSVNDGFNSMIKQVNDAKPTVLLVGYGMNESFDGVAGLENFKTGLTRLLNELDKTKARIVLLSPLRHEKMPAPLPDPTEHNKSIALYVAALKDEAAKRNYGFVDLFTEAIPGMESDNGIHPTAQGYWAVSLAIIRRLGLTLPSTLDAIKVATTGIPGGNLSASLSPLEKMRLAINAKNELFFYRWRPQNETYIYGFRKHEQGKNAADIPHFDPLVEAKEKEIAGLRGSAAALVK